MTPDEPPVELTEDYIVDHTDTCLGTVVLRATQVRALIRHHREMRRFLLELRPALRAIALANNDREAEDFADKISAVLGED